MAEAKTKPAAPANAKGAKPEKPKKGGGKLGFYTAMIVAGFAAPFMFPTIILVLAGMLPTLVAFFVDKDREHSSATAIGALNCAGITPFVIDLWIKGQSMSAVFQILSDPSSWLIILGAAAIGQVIVSVVPQAMATVTFAHSELRIKTLKHNLELLKNSWGPDVGTTKPIEKLTRPE
jgi:hypothetical protein